MYDLQRTIFAGGPNEVKSSSALKAQGSEFVHGDYAHDSDYKTAWVKV
jgi:hypothetical protein